jgi:hypothetical protein
MIVFAYHYMALAKAAPLLSPVSPHFKCQANKINLVRLDRLLKDGLWPFLLISLGDEYFSAIYHRGLDINKAVLSSRIWGMKMRYDWGE